MTYQDWQLIVSSVAEALAIPAQHINSRMRSKDCVNARAACYLIARSQFPGIRDHTLADMAQKERSAVCYLRGKSVSWFEHDPYFRANTQKALRLFIARRAQRGERAA